MVKYEYYKTWYSDSFYKRITDIIGTSEAFLKSNAVEQSNIFNNLKKISSLSELSYSFTKDFKYDNEDFSVEQHKFNLKYMQELETIVKRKDSAVFINQLRLSITYIGEFLYAKGYIKSSVNVNEIINKLDSNLVFNTLLSSFVACIQVDLNYTIGVERIEYGEVTKQTFHRLFMKNLLIQIITCILNDKDLMTPALHQELSDIISFTCKKSLFKSSYQLLSFFISVFEFESRKVTLKDKYAAIKSSILIKIPERILDRQIPASFIPQIIKPTNDFESMEDNTKLYKRIKMGFSSVVLSSLTKEAFKITQSKRFVINKKAIELFKYLDTLVFSEICELDMLPFVPIGHLIHLEKEIHLFEYIIPNKLFDDIENCFNTYYNLKKKESLIDSDSASYITKTLLISHERLDQYRKLKALKAEYKHKVALRVMHNTIIRFAEIFEGFPIYFLNSYDYRLRMYPWNYMFNRTSGNYKYLLIEPKTTLKKNGIEIMIINYLKNDSEKSENFMKVKRMLDKDQLVNWFNTNIDIDNMQKNSSFFYYRLLGEEIRDLIKNKFKSGFLLEIDQKSSASVFLAIILGDLVLAEQTNLISGNDIKDINLFIMEKSANWFKDKVSEKSYKNLISNRNLHKYLFMLSIYNQTTLGRLETIREYIDDKNDRKIIADEYAEFINSIFPSITRKKEKFNNIIRFYVEKAKTYIDLESLDHSLVKWKVHSKKRDVTENIKIYNSESKSNISVYSPSYDSEKLSMQKTVIGMLPSFIHSVDAAVMRYILLDVYKKNKYVINHLHDSIQFRPSMYGIVQKSIVNVYTSNIMNNILMNKLLNRLRNNILEENDKQKFDSLVEELCGKDFHNINITKENFNITGMFPFE